MMCVNAVRRCCHWIGGPAVGRLQAAACRSAILARKMTPLLGMQDDAFSAIWERILWPVWSNL
jgi:hypothetical protein